jgi:chromosome segregation ATPase
LLGIPATERHNDSKTYTQNGYGGLEALDQMKSLLTGDLARLYDFFGEDDDIHDFLLAPRVTPLPADELEPVLNSIGVRREMASILTEFGPENLAQRIFGTVSVLQKVVSCYSRVEAQLDASDSATRSAVAAQGDLSEIKRAYQFQSEYWTKKVAEVLEEKDIAVRNSREDLQQLVREHSRNKRGLQRQVEKLTSQLDDAKAHNRILEGHLQQSRVEVADVMNFLNDHSQPELAPPSRSPRALS